MGTDTGRDTYPFRRAAPALLGIALATGLATGCGYVGDVKEIEQDAPADARVASEVKLALIEVDGIDAAAVRVDAADGRVTLSGFVASEDERERTLAAARSALGDYELVDEMKVHD